ncbi:helix-turn-helix domain-containing protein [Pedobacter sp.]|uniref:helix-turn-helix domain-containing protein n=1 Tax=Pedobacter sp. TaxID=1411316 RepID=UPI003D7F42D4
MEKSEIDSMVTNPISKGGIFFSCHEDKHRVTEYFIPEHLLVHVHQGEIIVQEADRTYSITKGQTALFARNQLAKFTKVPDGDAACKSITFFFYQSFLQQHFDSNRLQTIAHKGTKLLQFGPHPLLNSLFNSVLPYYDFAGELSENLIAIKLNEALTILREISHSVDDILRDLSEPGKLDISDFMDKNYVFNIPLRRFAYLTGRSLSTFKRDFQKAYSVPPQKWLHQKRLEQAHYLIAEKKHKPSEVYLQVGFENLSHFSASFKKAFGYNVSSL